jgi:hypothetical protein
MKFFDSYWSRLNSSHVRIALAVVSVLAMVLSGSAGDYW